LEDMPSATTFLKAVFTKATHSFRFLYLTSLPESDTGNQRSLTYSAEKLNGQVQDGGITLLSPH
jgi:hypothetical protein